MEGQQYSKENTQLSANELPKQTATQFSISNFFGQSAKKALIVCSTLALLALTPSVVEAKKAAKSSSKHKTEKTHTKSNKSKSKSKEHNTKSSSKSSKSSKKSRTNKKRESKKYNKKRHYHDNETKSEYNGNTVFRYDVAPRREINDFTVVSVGFKSSVKYEITPMRQSIVNAAEKYLGLRYVLGGYSPNHGYDCSGLVRQVLSEHGITLDPTARQQQYFGEQIPLDYVRTGDLVFFSDSPNGRVSHVAIVVSFDENGLEVIHATNSKGIVRENISNSSYWMRKLRYASNILGAKDYL
jgi:N-acetylmuramoyl-L-alanine amidase